MLDFFRQKGLTSIVYGAIIVAMVLVFVLSFNPSAGKKLGSMSEACSARVLGSCIEPKAHRAAYRVIFPRGPGRMGKATSSKIVLEGLIERELLASEAQRLGLTVSEDEINDSILRGFILASVPADNSQLARQLGLGDGKVPAGFKDPKTKQFDLKVYERMVKQLTGRSPMEFREWQSRELLAAKMRDLVRAPVRVSDDESFDRYAKERTTATLNYVVVRKSWIEKYGIAADPKDVDAWAKDKANVARVSVPVRHILVKAGAKPEEKEGAKKKAEEILARIKKGEDFAKLAKEFSEDPGSKDNGGQYPGEMVERFVDPFKKTVAKLAPGELSSELTETDFGWHIIKRDAASKDDLMKAFKETKSLDLSKAMAQKIETDVKAGKSGEEAVKAAIAQYAITKPAPKPAAKDANAKGDAGATADGKGGDAGAAEPAAPTYTAETDPERPQFLVTSAFNQGGEPIPGVTGAPSQQAVEFAFKAKPGEAAAPIRTDDGFLVVALKDLKPATKADFDKDRDVYMDGLLHEKQAEALSFYVRRLREASKDEIKVDEKNTFGLEKVGDAGAGAAPPMDEDEDGP